MTSEIAGKVRGFTLPEVLIASALFVALASAITSLTSTYRAAILHQQSTFQTMNLAESALSGITLNNGQPDVASIARAENTLTGYGLVADVTTTFQSAEWHQQGLRLTQMDYEHGRRGLWTVQLSVTPAAGEAPFILSRYFSSHVNEPEGLFENLARHATPP